MVSKSKSYWRKRDSPKVGSTPSPKSASSMTGPESTTPNKSKKYNPPHHSTLKIKSKAGKVVQDCKKCKDATTNYTSNT